MQSCRSYLIKRQKSRDLKFYLIGLTPRLPVFVCKGDSAHEFFFILVSIKKNFYLKVLAAEAEHFAKNLLKTVLFTQAFI